jgi:hypothetical protein
VKEAAPHLSHVGLVHELAAFGVFGLLVAADRYDPSRGKFSTYANNWVRKYIRLYLEEIIGVVPRTGDMGDDKPRRSVMDLVDAALNGVRLHRGKAAAGTALFDASLTIPGPNRGDKEIETVGTDGPTDPTRLDYLQRRVGQTLYPWVDMGTHFTPRLVLRGHPLGRASAEPPREYSFNPGPLDAIRLPKTPVPIEHTGPATVITAPPAEVCYLRKHSPYYYCSWQTFEPQRRRHKKSWRKPSIIEAVWYDLSPERAVNVRVGGLDGKIYIDLGCPNWRAISIDERGWQEIDDVPVRFRRSAGMLALPAPMRGSEALKEFRKLINVKSDEDFDLLIAYLLAALRDHGPYPVLVLSGEQGSAKSTLSKMARSLIDPNSAPLRALPREDRDLFIAANNGYVLTFDNVSGLPTWISDTLCRLATGGGFAVRQLYTDQDEVLFDAQRPIILNGIEDIVSRPDLADRALFITLEAIPEDKRKTEDEVMAALSAVQPYVLAALLDAVVHGLRRIDSISLGRLPRMADRFHRWHRGRSAHPAGVGIYRASSPHIIGLISLNFAASSARS